MDAFTQLDIQCASNDEMKPRVSNTGVEITIGCRLTLEWDGVFERYVISFSKFKWEEQFYFAAKVNIIHIRRLQDGLNALVSFIGGKNLNQIVTSEKESFFGCNR